MIRAWLPKRHDTSRTKQEQEFENHLTDQLRGAGLTELNSLRAKSLRHFAFQDDLGKLVEPDAEQIVEFSSEVLANAEQYFGQEKLDYKLDAQRCAGRDLLVDLKPFVDAHGSSTITFIMTISVDSMAEESKQHFGRVLFEHLNAITSRRNRLDGSGDAGAVDQLSLYRCVGYADFLLMGRIMDGSKFHALNSELIAPVVGSQFPGSAARVHTTTHIVVQRGLLIAEERLTGIESPEMPSVWASDAADPEPAFGYKKSTTESGLLIGGRFRVPDEFRPDSALGKGGYSEVFGAFDTFMDIRRAVKLLSPGDQTAFAEANILRNCRHPGIVSYVMMGRHDDRYYVVMEYVEGSDLRHFIQPSGDLSRGAAVMTVSQVLEALASVHPDDLRIDRLRAKGQSTDLTEDEASEYIRLLNSGIVHRDIKPENIMIRPDGTVVLVDFGISVPARSHTDTRRGTPGYMAPDAGLDGWEPSDDIFACGVVLYEMLTGKIPYRNDEDEVIEVPIAVTDRAAVSDQLGEIVMKACASQRNDRFDRAVEFSERLMDTPEAASFESP
jgi:serine/threonine-protein kinase